MDETRWRRITDWPLAMVALVFLAAYSWEVIVNLEGPASTFTEIVIDATWAIFLTDYVVRLIIAPRRWHWFWTHLFDLAIVALPMLRPLRLLRLVTLLTILQRTTGMLFRGRVVIYAAGGSALLVYVAALAELDAERGHGNIENFGDALWWAFVTITTVGYGDYFPVTLMGRLVAVGVMIGGIALIGVVTATLASWIIEQVSASDRTEGAHTRTDLEELTQQVATLQQLIESGQTTSHAQARPLDH